MTQQATNQRSVLYLSYDGMTDPLGQSQVLPYLCGLSRHGYRFTLISFEKQERFAQNRVAIEHICAQHQIKWLPLPYTKKPPVLSTVYDLLKLQKTASSLHRTNPFNLVHCRSYPMSLIGLYLKRKFGVAFVFDMRGFWADERVDGNLWNLKNPMYNLVYRFFKNKEKQFLETADCTISLTRRAAAEIRSWRHLNQNKVHIEVIPCCVDMELFDPNKVTPQQKEQLCRELNIAPEQQFVLSYLGSLGTWYMTNEMMQFFKTLKTVIPQAVFLLITPDAPDAVLAVAKNNGLQEQDLRITFKPRNQVPAALSLSRYSMFFIKPAYSKMSSSPTKQGEIMAMGIPVLCNAHIGDTDAIVQQYASGICIDNFTPEAYLRAAKTMAETSANPQTAIHIRAGAKDCFSLQSGVEQYLAVYQKILQPTPKLPVHE
ncbi:glycosyltransferase [Sphingobacteriales bacterium UPWRP_1]|nr:hypothetical protein BVG80_03460 [Sphingobacteriales bacterium TSM_CSM]PSJ75622.1 glycosyltransferase [Sphingobacteriales bacterium UPWRP_1]